MDPGWMDITPTHPYWNTTHSTHFNNETNSTKGEYEKIGTFVYSAGFLCTVLFLAVFLRENLKKTHFPYAVLLFTFGAILGGLDYYFESFHKFTNFTRSNIVIHLLLPLIIYNYSFRMNPHMFMVAFVQCIILAFPAFVICAGLSTVFAKIVLSLYKWDWSVCILFGTILTATDPSALIYFLKDSGISAGLITIIEGEAMLSSGIALVFLKAVLKSLNETELIFEKIILHVIQYCLGSFAFGYIFAMVIIAILRRSENDTDIEVTFTLCSAYITYFVSELYLDVSGILAVVTLSVYLSSYKSSMMNFEGEDTTVHQFWQTLSFWARTLIFTIVGVRVSSAAFIDFEYADFGLIIASYFMVNVFRGCTIAIFTPLLKRIGYGFTWKSAAMLTWGGLRGAIGLALVMLIRKKEHSEYEIPDILNKLLIQVSGVIILTLIFNASTIHWLLKSLDVGIITDKSVESMAHTVVLLRDAIQITEAVTRMDKYLAGADWVWVRRVTEITNPYEEKKNVYSTMMKNAFRIFRGRCQDCGAEIRIEPTDSERLQMEEESKLLALRALKTCVANQYENYGVLRRSLGHLNTCIENALVKPDKQLLAEDVKKKFLKVEYYIKFLNKYMMRLVQKLNMRYRNSRFREYHLLKEKNLSPFRKLCIKVHLSLSFKTLMYWVIILNTIPIVGEFTSVFTKYRINESAHLGEEMIFYEVFNATLALFYIWETIVRVTAMGWTMYFKSKRNIIDFIVTVTATAQNIYGLVLISAYRYTYSMASLYVLLSLSAIRLLRLIKVMCSEIFWNILDRLSTTFYNAFDLAIGFIVAQEEIAKSVHKMIENETCARHVQFAAEDNVFEMLCYANEIDQEHPDITCAWRTHRAILYILRNMKEFIEEMVSIYMLDETDAEHLLEEIESKITETLNLPRHMKQKKGVRNCLKNVLWIKSESMLEKIVENYSMKSFSRDDVIHDIGEQHGYMKVLYTGIIKISGTSTGEKRNILPNTDSMRYFNSAGNFLISTDSFITLGALGYLLRTPSVTRVISSNASQMIYVPFAVILEMEKEYGSLSFHMWRPIALEIAFIVLKDEKAYENWSVEKLKIHVEEGIFLNLEGKEEFDVHSIIADMVLIQGRVLDESTDTVYTGPIYIPHAVRSLKLLDNHTDRPRVVILLLREEKFHASSIMKWVETDEVQHVALCFVHGVRRMSHISSQQMDETVGRRLSLIQKLGKLFKSKDSTSKILESDDL